MTQDELKRKVAKAAIEYVVDDAVIGVGTGSTADLFIDELASAKRRIPGAVASSERTAERLRRHGIRVVGLDEVDEIPVYVDGADEVTLQGAMTKGGGGALTREKIVAAVARRFVCIVDASKVVEVLGRFPVPVEVIPMARGHVARQLSALGGRPSLRERFVTDNGNVIVDVSGLSIADPVDVEQRIESIVGVVTAGLFARRGADAILIGNPDGVRVVRPGAAPVST